MRLKFIAKFHQLIQIITPLQKSLTLNPNSQFSFFNPLAMPKEITTSQVEKKNPNFRNLIAGAVGIGAIAISPNAGAQDSTEASCITAGVIMEKKCGVPCVGVKRMEFTNINGSLGFTAFPDSVIQKGKEGYGLYHDGKDAGLETKTLASSKNAILSVGAFGNPDRIYTDARRKAIKDGQVSWDQFINDTHDHDPNTPGIQTGSRIEDQIVTNCGVTPPPEPGGDGGGGGGCFVDTVQDGSVNVAGEVILKEIQALIETAKGKIAGVFQKEAVAQ